MASKSLDDKLIKGSPGALYMSMFKCPLCGKTNSYNRFNPEGFDDDILGVTVSGLGRGKGFGFSDSYSLLDDAYLTGLIKARCRHILRFTEGEEPPPPRTVNKLTQINRDWATWSLETNKTLMEKESEIRRLGNENVGLRGQVNTLREQVNRSGPSIHAVEAEELRRANRQWQVAYANLEQRNNAKDREINDLKASYNRAKNEVATLREQLKESLEEDVCAVEMEELLEKINDSSNTDYDNLSDAIDYLLEG